MNLLDDVVIRLRRSGLRVLVSKGMSPWRLYHFSGVMPRSAPTSSKRCRWLLNDVCKVLDLDGKATAKEHVAMRIIELARGGERSPTKLRDRLKRRRTAGCSLIPAHGPVSVCP